MKKRLGIDLDGVIYSYKTGWAEGELRDPPVEGAISALNRLGEEYELYIFTTRANPEYAAHYDGLEAGEAITAWLTDNGVTADFTVGYIKEPCMAYIDDRAVRFTNWPDIRKLFM